MTTILIRGGGGDIDYAHYGHLITSLEGGDIDHAHYGHSSHHIGRTLKYLDPL